MKRIRVTELFAEIRANIVAFISISMFVCLGVGLFFGIAWGGLALGNAVDEAFALGNMHDVEIQFPYGMTEDDVQKIKAVDGVTEVETGYSTFAKMLKDKKRYVLKLQSLTKRIDVPIHVQGTLPTHKGEIALLSLWADEHGVKVGDTVSLVSDATSKDDGDGMEYLTSNTFTVTAIVDHPAYLCKVSGMIGTANIGSGNIDCVGFLAKDSFDTKKFNDAYPNVYVRCDGLQGKSTFGDEYTNELNKVVDDMVKLGGPLGKARYEYLHDDAQGKLNDGQAKIDDGQKLFDDGVSKAKEGEKKLTDGEKELADAQQMLDDGKKKLDNGAQELAAGEAKLNDARRQLVAGEQQLKDRRQTAQTELAKARAELDAGKAKLEEAQKQYDAGKAEYEKSKAAYDKVKSQFDTKVAEVEGLLAQAQSTLDQKKTELEQGQALLNQKKAEYEEAKALYEQKLKEYESGKATLKDKKAELEKAKKTLEEKRKELEDAKVKLADAKKQFADMKEFEWIVSPRGENGGTQAVSTMVQMMGNVRWWERRLQ